MPKFNLHLGDITELDCDAIVNAANAQLMKGSGVCGAIFKAAGNQLDEHCARLGSCETGQSVITPAFNLKAKYIIHTVGPIYNREPINAPKLLASAYSSALKLAEENKIKTIAFPCISTGIYGYPTKEAADIAIKTCLNFKSSTPLNITFCCFDEENYMNYHTLLEGI